MQDQLERDRRNVIKPTLRNICAALEDPDFCGFTFRLGPHGVTHAVPAGSDVGHWIDPVVISRIRFALLDRGFTSVPKGFVRDACRLVAIRPAPSLADHSDLV